MCSNCFGEARAHETPTLVATRASSSPQFTDTAPALVATRTNLSPQFTGAAPALVATRANSSPQFTGAKFENRVTS